MRKEKEFEQSKKDPECCWDGSLAGMGCGELHQAQRHFQGPMLWQQVETAACLRRGRATACWSGRM